MRRRRKSRILALCMLYGMEQCGDFSPGAARLVTAMFSRKFDQGIEEYALHLVRGVTARRTEIDTLIRTNARNWQYNRIALVDRQIMRLALWEMLFDKHTPPAVCINEAIDIAKLFSTGESGHFINGILDNVRKLEQMPRTTRGSTAAADDTAATE